MYLRVFIIHVHVLILHHLVDFIYTCMTFLPIKFFVPLAQGPSQVFTINEENAGRDRFNKYWKFTSSFHSSHIPCHQGCFPTEVCRTTTEASHNPEFPGHHVVR